MRLALALHFAVCLLTAAPIYQVVDLGSLSTATAVNSAGVAGGWSLNGASMHAMASNGAGAAQSLDPTHQSQAFGINDVGQVVGIRHDANGNAQATMWFSDGSATALGA